MVFSAARHTCHIHGGSGVSDTGRGECAWPDPTGTIGQASLGREGLVFTGQVDGKHETILFPISLMDVLPVALGKHFEICDENGVYWQFALDGDAKAVLFEQYADICLYGEGSSWV